MSTGRNYELDALKECYSKEKNCICILYGRKGLGKTELVKEFAKDKTYFYHKCMEVSQKASAMMLEESLCTFMKKETLNSEHDIYNMLYELCEQHKSSADKITLVFDEFQNMVKVLPDFIAILVKLTRIPEFAGLINIIMISSSIKWIENDMAVEIGAVALAISKIIKMRETSFKELMLMHSGLDTNEAIKVYSVFGGVRRYLKAYNTNITFEENLLKMIGQEDSLFSNEVYTILKSDLRELGQYNTILYTIALGNNKLNDIYELTGFSRAKISVYLKNLIDIDIVEKVFSYETEVSGATQKGLYRIKDNLVNFWYSCIFQNQDTLVFDGKRNEIINSIIRQNYVLICQEYIKELCDKKVIDFVPNNYGTWYGKAGTIDMIMNDEEKRYIVGDCFWEKQADMEDYKTLLLKLKKSRIKPWKIILFSKDGFSEELTKLSVESDNIILITNSDL